MAMDVSCHSFLRMATLAGPLMTDSERALTVTFHDQEKVAEEYNHIGPVKAALESCVRYRAAESGRQRICVHALSPGPIATRAASRIESFDALLEPVDARMTEHRLVSFEDVGNLAAFLTGDAATALTGNIEYVDAGYHIIG